VINMLNLTIDGDRYSWFWITDHQSGSCKHNAKTVHFVSSRMAHLRNLSYLFAHNLATCCLNSINDTEY
jgi:hypothetical protein